MKDIKTIYLKIIKFFEADIYFKIEFIKIIFYDFSFYPPT